MGPLGKLLLVVLIPSFQRRHELHSISPERNRCCGAHAFFERKVSEQLIAISLVELPSSGDSEQENHSEEERPGSEERKRVAMNSEERKRETLSSREERADSDSEEERWRQLMKEEAEYEEHLERQVAEFEEESK